METEPKYTLKELKESLKEKQKKFCHRWIIDYNNVKSYMFAYPDTTYNSASASADNLLENTRIKKYINFIKNDFEKEAGITKIKQLQELHKMAYSSIAHMHNTWIELKDFEKLTDDQKASIESIDTKTETRLFDEGQIDVKYVKVKLHSKQSALAEINKMMGYHEAEKIKHSGEIQGQEPTIVVLNESGKKLNMGKYKSDKNKNIL